MKIAPIPDLEPFGSTNGRVKICRYSYELSIWEVCEGNEVDIVKRWKRDGEEYIRCMRWKNNTGIGFRRGK
jgi:hypothetical protein